MLKQAITKTSTLSAATLPNQAVSLMIVVVTSRISFILRTVFRWVLGKTIRKKCFTKNGPVAIAIATIVTIKEADQFPS